jgi:hypothetical protein
MYTCFISVDRLLVVFRCIYLKLFFYFCFPCMVIMNRLLPVSVAYIAKKMDVHSRNVAADAAARL